MKLDEVRPLGRVDRLDATVIAGGTKGCGRCICTPIYLAMSVSAISRNTACRPPRQLGAINHGIPEWAAPASKYRKFALGPTFGHSTDEREAKRIVDLAFDAGINFFDTAAYGGGESEVITGKTLKGRRRDAVIATKFFNPMGPGPNDSGMSRVRIMNAVEDSLQRLQTDYIDLYYIHHVDTQTPLEEMLRALDDLVRQGKVRYTACSNYQAWRLMEALWISERTGWRVLSATNRNTAWSYATLSRS